MIKKRCEVRRGAKGEDAVRRSLFGYRTRDVKERIDALTEQNALLMGRLERQEEEIKELRSRYASFVGAEAKLKSSSRMIEGSVAAIEEALVDADGVARASRELSDMLATAYTSIEQADRVRERDACIERALLEMKGGIDSALELLKEDARVCSAADSERMPPAGDAAAIVQRLEHGVQSLSNVSAEFESLSGAVDAIAGVATQLGRMGNGGLADIERARVTALLEKANLTEQPSVTVRLQNPDELIDNPVPAGKGENRQ